MIETQKIGKFKLGERVEMIKLSSKSDFPLKGHIIDAHIRLGKYVYGIRFDTGLFKKPIYRQVYELQTDESNIKYAKDEVQE